MRSLIIQQWYDMYMYRCEDNIIGLFSARHWYIFRCKYQFRIQCPLSSVSQLSLMSGLCRCGSVQRCDDCDDDGRLISATRVINNITAQSSELAVWLPDCPACRRCAVPCVHWDRRGPRQLWGPDGGQGQQDAVHQHQDRASFPHDWLGIYLEKSKAKRPWVWGFQFSLETTASATPNWG